MKTLWHDKEALELKLSEQEYRSLPYESYSSLKTLLDKSPMESFLHYKEKPFKGNASTILGSAVHLYIQGRSDLVMFHNKSIAAKSQAKVNLFLANTNHEGVVLPIRFEPIIKLIMDNVEKHHSIINFIKGAEVETAYTMNYKDVTLKGRLDFEKEDCIIDIKTTSSGVSRSEFKDTVTFSHYDMQAALYQLAVNKAKGILKPYYFIAISTREPFNCEIYKASETMLLNGLAKLDDCVDKYIKYIVNKEPWANNDIEEI